MEPIVYKYLWIYFAINDEWVFFEQNGEQIYMTKEEASKQCIHLFPVEATRIIFRDKT